MRYHHEGTSSPQSARFGQSTASFSGRSRMKKLMLLIIALAALPGGALFAQDITGTWQGTLLAGKQELSLGHELRGYGGDALVGSSGFQGGRRQPRGPLS